MKTKEDLYEKAVEALTDWLNEYEVNEPLVKVPLLEVAYESWFRSTDVKTCLIAFERMKIEALRKYDFVTDTWEEEDEEWVT